MNQNDQARRLREMTRDLPAGTFLRQQRKRQPPRIVSFISGRGGVGKSFLALNLACLWALRGKKTLLVDADYAMGHIDYLLGLNAKYSIQHLVEGKAEIEDIVVEGPWGMKFIPGMAGDITRVTSEERAREIIPDIAQWDDWSDLVVCDTTTGVGRPTFDIINTSSELILVTTPETASVMDSYGMVKYISKHSDNGKVPRVRLVVNQITSREEGRKVAASLRSVAGRFLGRGISCLGFIPRDDEIEEASRKHVPFIKHAPRNTAARAIEEIASYLINEWSDPLEPSSIT